MAEQQRDLCPACDRHISPSLAFGPGSGDTGNGVPRYEHEERDCPHCGSTLTRLVGGKWRKAGPAGA